jgi:glycosyltransferase involved in cell wall biosynthesis
LKIAIATRHVHPVGGIETYLAAVMPALVARGHQLYLWHEFRPPTAAAAIAPAGIGFRHIGRDGTSIDELRREGPDVIFLQGLSDPDLEAALARIAPVVALLHAYHGTCVSETKLHQTPDLEVCSRALGPGCLVQYFPRRCGGLSPISMVANYRRQRARQSLLRRFEIVATVSEHMRREAIAQGVAVAQTVCLPAFTPPETNLGRRAVVQRMRSTGDRKHVLFVGRMEQLKGGHLLLDAMTKLDRDLRRNVTVTFAGDGRERPRWEAEAARISREGVEIRFVGWVDEETRTALFGEADLLVVPSIWPEPFGLIGLEAAAAGVPAVAFDVGGVGEWLTDNVTGRLIPTPPISSQALAAGIADCLSDSARLRTWGTAARAMSRRRTLAAHVSALESVFERVATPGTQQRWRYPVRKSGLGARGIADC